MMMSKLSLDAARRGRWAGLVIFVTSAALACTDKPETAPVITDDPGSLVQEVFISPTSAFLVVGDSTTFSGFTKIKASHPGLDNGVRWSSSAPDVAKIDARGMVIALRAGDAKITAKSNVDSNVLARATISVIPAQRIWDAARILRQPTIAAPTPRSPIS